MIRNRKAERGEGKVGCLISLAVFVVAALVVYKLLPVYLHYDELVTFAKESAVRAGIQSTDDMQTALVNKAKVLEIREATVPGAIQVSRTGDKNAGVCNITIKYSQNVDFFGVTSVKLDFDKSVSLNYVDSR
jgi:hypothetical protein